MKKILLIFSILLVAVMLVSCAPTELKPAEKMEIKEPIKIGFIGPLTGNAANVGLNALEGAKLAADEINAAGGINGRMLEIFAEDGICNAKDATNAANKLVNIDKVPAIVGGACSAETLAAAPIAEGKTVMISPTSSNPAITTAGDYIFRDYPSDLFQGKMAAEFAYNELNARKAATLYCLSDYCVGIRDVFEQVFKELGGEIVTSESFEMSSRDLRTSLAKIKAAEPDLIFFPAYTDDIITGLKQMKELGVEAQILGADAWDDPKIFTDAGDAAEGIIYLVPFTPFPEEFKQKVLAITGGDSVVVGTPQAYDAVYIFADAMKKVGTDPEAIKNALYEMPEYQGVSGSIEFDENGDLVYAEYAKKTFKNGELVDYE